ncbi:hypothetical protein [Streptomyces sp. NPDC057939]|uniref:hypothetical protein n=1 Tax=Streptomyces sp. NPDC057939 TaxID=3346284 RepID=UPI0036E95104
MYRLAAEDVLPNTPPMYRRLSSPPAQARREDSFPDPIDTVREVDAPPAWPRPDAFVKGCPIGSGWTVPRTRSTAAPYVAAAKAPCNSSCPAGSSSRAWPCSWSAASAVLRRCATTVCAELAFRSLLSALVRFAVPLSPAHYGRLGSLGAVFGSGSCARVEVAEEQLAG